MRTILHVRVASFSVAVEVAAEPFLRGRPLAIVPQMADRARLLAVSPAARREGLRPGMELSAARRSCPGLIVRPPNPALCARAHQVLFDLACRHSPLVEPAGAGALYLDLTGTGRLLGAPQDVARRIGLALRGDYHLPAGLGVASNKLVSRVAARADRPAHPCAVRGGEEERFLAPFPVGVLPGVGLKLRAELLVLNIHWVRELARMALMHLVLAFGRVGEVLQRRARGVDPTPVVPPDEEPAIDGWEPLPEDTNDFEELKTAARRLASRVAAEARSIGAFPGRMELTIRYADGKEERLQRLLPLDAAHELVLIAAVLAALPRAVARRVRVKSLGLRLTDLDAGVRQLDLFAPARRQQAPRRLDAALDLLRSKYGASVIAFPNWGPSTRAGTPAPPAVGRASVPAEGRNGQGVGRASVPAEGRNGQGIGRASVPAELK
jgi:DNA polymerase-4